MRGRIRQLLLIGSATLILAVLNAQWVAGLPAAASASTAGLRLGDARPKAGATTGPPAWSTYKPATVIGTSIGGPAARAGLRKGDQILAINGIPAYSYQDLHRLVDNSRIGASLEYTVLRGTETRTVPLRLEGRLDGHWAELMTYACAAGLFFGVGVFVYWKRPRDPRALPFFLMCLLFALLFSNLIIVGEQLGDFVGRSMTTSLALVTALIFFLFPPLLHFTLIFPKPRPLVEKYPGILGWVYALPTLITILFVVPGLYILWSASHEMSAGYSAGQAMHRFFRFLEGRRLVSVAAAIGLLSPAVFLFWKCVRSAHQKGLTRILLSRPGLVISTLFFTPLLFGLALIPLSAAFASPPAFRKWVLGAIPIILLVELAGALLAQLIIPVAACVSLFRNYRSSGITGKQQLRWPLWGTITAVAGFFLSFGSILLLQRLGPGLTGGWWLTALQILEGTLPTLFLLLIPISFAFAITKYRLMDIQLVIRKTLIYGAATGIVGLFSLIVAGGLSILLHRFSQSASEWVTVGTTLSAVALMVPARNRAQAMVDRRFFRRQHDYPAALRLLGREVLEANDRQRLLNAAAERLLEALYNRSVVIFLKRPADRAFAPAAQAGLPEEAVQPVRYAANSALLAQLGGIASPAELDLPEAERDKLSRLRCGLLVPVHRKGGLMAFLALGTKLSEEEYDQQDREFLSAASDHLAAGLENLSLSDQQRESDRAQEIQQALIPKQIPQTPGFAIAGAWQPARAVGGDYYDVLALGDGKIGLVIADVSGKGVPAALLMSNLQATVRAYCVDHIQPGTLCQKVNTIVCGNISPGKFITFFYAVVDPATRTLAYTNAGHNPPMLLRDDGALLRLDKGGAVLGLFPQISFEQEEVELRRGDRLLLFTDGVSEAFNEDEEEFGEDGLVQLLRSQRTLDPVVLKETVLRAVTDFCNGNFHDDVTLIALTVLD